MTDLSGNDHLLFQRTAAGDEAAFDKLFHSFLPRLYPFVIRFTKSEAAAQEVIQETFIRVWMNRDKLEDITNPGGWLFKVASNECYTYARKQALRDRLFASQAVEGAIDMAAGDPTQEWLDSRDLGRLIAEAVDRLPSQRKRIYQMSRQDGMTIPEIADKLQLSPNTVKNALSAALHSIRAYLARYGVTLIALDLFLFY